MRHQIALTGLAGVAACALPSALSAKESSKPNILIIYTDDMGIGDLSCYNNGWSKTPNIDKLASEGVVFDQYYSSAPVSSPSRAGLTTGIYPLQLGIHTYLHDRRGNTAWEQNNFLDSSIPTMADAMRGAGYATAHIGKWHMGGGRDVHNAPHISEYGFDECVSTWESPDPDPKLTASNWIWCKDDEVKRWERTSYFVDRTLDFLARHKGTPCFVNFWPDDMHTPWVPGPATQDKEKSWSTPKNFEQVLAEYDRQIGALMDGLRRLGLDRNTIVIFTSDNGPAPSFEQQRTNDLRGVKNSLYEGGINMPFIVRWTDKIVAGQRDSSSVICAVDLLPSLSAIAGAKMPKRGSVSGENMSEALMGRPQVRRNDLMWEYGMAGKSPVPNPYNRSPHLAIRRGSMKLVMNADRSAVELYDLSTDPKEKINIAENHPKLVAELSAKLTAWWAARPRPTH